MSPCRWPRRATRRTHSPTGTTSPRPTGRCSRCSPRPGSARTSRPRTGRGRRSCWPRRRDAGAGRGHRDTLGRSPQAAVAFVGLNPLVLVYGIGGDHNEPLMLLCAVGGGRAGGGRPRRAARRGGTPAPAHAQPSPRASSRRRHCWCRSSSSACRRRLPALGGAAAPARWSWRSSAVAYGGHLPSAAIQDRLVNPLSVPNVLAALAGHGGETAHDRASPTSRSRSRHSARRPRSPGGAHGCQAPRLRDARRAS